MLSPRFFSAALAGLAFSFLLLSGCGTVPTGNYPMAYVMAPSFDSLDRERYGSVAENPFQTVASEPLSTFSVDVDTAGYSNIRRFLRDGRLPPVDAVRIEELVNYFSYDYPEPGAEHPFSISTELARCPWNPQHQLLRIGLKGRSIGQEDMPPANLVFLIDVSGSMYERLPLVKSALRLLIQEMRPQDRIALVAYAGAAGVVLPSTSGDQKAALMQALERLEAGGSTAGGAGIRLAYEVAAKSRQPGSNDRVILATDGDFNVGPATEEALLALIEEERQRGISLSVLGFGRGNLNDATMELLADRGNGNYAYIDSQMEAQKVLISQMGGTLLTIAKDVKLQLQFNPARAQAYRLIGYENRLLDHADFADDAKDAGEIGAGHRVTALYEIVPTSPSQQSDTELVRLNLRYKLPDEQQSRLLSHSETAQSVDWHQASEDFRFASAVAEFGLLLRNSPHKGGADWRRAEERAAGAMGADRQQYRAELLQLLRAAEGLAASALRSTAVYL